MDFKSLYESHKNLVYNLALQYVQNIENAEEITQDVFLTVHEKLGTFNAESNMQTWIYRITVNKSLDFIKAAKAQKRWAFFSGNRIEDIEQSVDIPDFNHPGVALEQKEAVKRIFIAINQLPDNQKTALLLLKIDGLSQIETAEIMESSPKAVESLFQRAKKNLSQIIEKTKDHG